MSIAQALGLAGAVACAGTLALTIALGLYSTQDLVYVMFVLSGLLGALILSREPRNGVGRLMCAIPLAGLLFLLPLDYGYAALVIERAPWPLAVAALWLNAWAWAPLLGLFVPLITVRFPDGQSRSRAVDRLAIAGTAVFALSIALAPSNVLDSFLPLPQTRADELAPFIQSPIGASLPAGLLAQVRIVGIALIVLAYVAAAVSLVSRFRLARDEESLQLKWFAYAGALIASALVLGAFGTVVLGWPFGNALLPLDFAAFTLPLAIGIAILRYRLYDIEIIINRTIVYVSLTAILGALYGSVVTFLQRLFISTSGQTSDAAWVLTTFAVVIAFSPVKDALQRQVDHRLGRATAAAALDQFSAGVDAIVSILDVDRVAHRFLDQALLAFDARGAALFLGSRTGDPAYSRGHLDGDAIIEVPLRHDGRQLGVLVLGGRRGDAAYTRRDRDALQRSADIVGEALAVSARLGQRSP